MPIMVDSSKWEVLETGLKNIQGKAVVNRISLKEGERNSSTRRRSIRRYGAAVVVMAFDEKGQADTLERKNRDLRALIRILTEQVGFPPQDIIFDPNILTVATGIEEHNNYAVEFHRSDAAGSSRIFRWRKSAAASAIFRFRSAGTMWCAKRCMRHFCITPSRPVSTWAL